MTAGANRGFRTAGTVLLRSGETGEIMLPTGHVVAVTATIRPETPEEASRAASAPSAHSEGVRRRVAGGSRSRTYAALSADPPF